MSEPGDFLARWSRRKRAAAELKSEPQPPAGEAAAPETRAPAQEETQVANRSIAPAETEFDLASLPPLDSIAADTDVRAFLKPGVPAGLRDAALRRAWSADPAIRDFRGLQENAWDFNDPDAMSGFGKLAADVDVREMATRIFGDAPEDTDVPLDTVAQAVPPAQNSGELRDGDAIADVPAAESDAATLPAAPTAQQEMVQREEDNAMRQCESNETIAEEKPHRHGGALPR